MSAAGALLQASGPGSDGGVGKLRFRPHVLSRRTHKWLALVVTVQAVIWSVSGLYMTAVHIDIIHGDHFVRKVEPKPLAVTGLISPLAAARVADGSSARLSAFLGRPVYVVGTEKGDRVVDARSGKPLPPPSQAEIRKAAEFRFAGPEKLVRLSLITEIPSEIRGREPPLWRADFSGWNQPTLYFSPSTGELVSRRHELWRIFDFVWMLHIMDYDERENVNNWLLRSATWLMVAAVLSGAWLLFFAFPRKRKVRRS
jgi:hypothetical protein